MIWQRLPIADIAAADASLKKLETGLDFVVVQCPFDDGTDDHALHLHNSTDALPAHAYCLSDKCKRVTPEEFLRLLGMPLSGRQ